MPDICDKHGPYSVFCRACDLETVERYGGEPDASPMPDAEGLERELIVAWLRGQVEAFRAAAKAQGKAVGGLAAGYTSAAAAIERGEHLPLRGAAIRALSARSPSTDVEVEDECLVCGHPLKRHNMGTGLATCPGIAVPTFRSKHKALAALSTRPASSGEDVG